VSLLEDLSPDDRVFLLETDRQTWIAIRGVDEKGSATQFRLAFSTLDGASQFAYRFPALGAKRVREIRLGDITTAQDPPLALDVDPDSMEQGGGPGTGPS
jgi:hypothetical protein